jgi:hypothetical protein
MRFSGSVLILASAIGLTGCIVETPHRPPPAPPPLGYGRPAPPPADYDRRYPPPPADYDRRYPPPDYDRRPPPGY